MPIAAVITAPDAKSIYEVPIVLEEQGLTDYILKRLGIDAPTKDLGQWREYLDRILYPSNSVRVAIVGSTPTWPIHYLSHLEAFHHAGAELGTKVECRFFDSEKVEHGRHHQGAGVRATASSSPVASAAGGSKEDDDRPVRQGEADTVPRGVPGIPDRHHRDRQGRPGMDGAHTTELDPETQVPGRRPATGARSVTNKGGSMRLGAQKVLVREGSKAAGLYGGNDGSWSGTGTATR